MISTEVGRSSPPPTVVRALIVVPADTAPTVKQFSVQRDRQVEIVVESELTDHVHLHGYDLTADVGPGVPATITLTIPKKGQKALKKAAKAGKKGPNGRHKPKSRRARKD